MNFQDVVRMSVAERSDYVVTAATKLGMSELIVEKDLWVVWMLEQLFALSPQLGPFTFKGGTSLSKGFNAIQRFSEDIDISIDRAKLGYSDDAYFYSAGSGKETRRRVEEIRGTVRAYTMDNILPALRTRISQELSDDWALDIDAEDSLGFRYPTAQRGEIGYVRPDVLIEFGHADSWPAQDVAVVPYLECLDAVSGSINVRVLDPQRTFWEKATILHEIAHRDEAIGFPPRYSRHYYDLAVLSRSDIGARAVRKADLLAAVAKFKNVFFYSGRARYDLAKPGTLRLTFPAYRRETIAADYAQMQPMLFGDVLSFDEVCQRITKLETQINTPPE